MAGKKNTKKATPAKKKKATKKHVTGSGTTGVNSGKPKIPKGRERKAS